VKLAGIFEAHLTGVAFVQNPASSGSLLDSAPVLDDCRRDMEAVAEAAKLRFEETLRRESLSAESMIVNARTLSFPELLARIARRFDLTVLQQPHPEDGRSAEIMIDAALLGSGRPILIVPYFWEGRVKFDRILVCWDGSHNAARSIADGMPFLTRANQVEVVTVTTDRSADDGSLGLDIGHYLSRHGASVKLRKIIAHSQKVSVRIHSHAWLQSIDLIVMGSYGHSRLRELVLGSTTRDILESAAIPILMSH
jgi:nucleotide-binding universal stress UspA family protein